MTPRPLARPAMRWLGMAALAVLVWPDPVRAGAKDTYFERTAMAAADLRCGLFTPEMRAALAMATAQARGAALRDGVPARALGEGGIRARALGGRVDCGSSELAQTAGDIRHAFDGFTRMLRLTYPGDVASWHADRAPSEEARWRLAQDVAAGPDRLRFGLAGREAPGRLMAVASFADGRAPYAARLLVRDLRRSPEPHLARMSSGPTRSLPLDRRTPSPSALSLHGAEARSRVGRDLLPKDRKTGWAFRCSPAAAAALAALDPREAVILEFLFAEGEARRAYVEVGDFAAGQAFVKQAWAGFGVRSGRGQPAED